MVWIDAKNAGQQLPILRAALQFHHFVVQARQVFRALDEELLEYVGILHHSLAGENRPQ